MLEHVPQWLGQAMRGMRAGADKLCVAKLDGGDLAEIDLSSPAFANGGRMPERFTADGEGVSPPLVWGPLPEGTEVLALIVEDPDAPAPEPFVHAVVWGISPDDHGLAEGEIRPDGAGTADREQDVGRNSYLREGWLPPDPPTGHGEHQYAFQLFALRGAQDPGQNPGRAALVQVIEGKVIGAGLLTGTYSRSEPSGDRDIVHHAEIARQQLA